MVDLPAVAVKQIMCQTDHAIFHLGNQVVEVLRIGAKQASEG